jgi:nickel/cobalt exporter
MGMDEKAKLKKLLNYWVEHNREHSEEFREWADKAKAMGETEVAGEMLEAVREMDKASELLLQSLKRLEEV